MGLELFCERKKKKKRRNVWSVKRTTQRTTAAGIGENKVIPNVDGLLERMDTQKLR